MKDDNTIIYEAYTNNKTLKDIIKKAIIILLSKKQLKPSDFWIFRIWPNTENEINFEIEVFDDGSWDVNWTKELADKTYSNEEYEDAIKQIKEIIINSSN